jgi:hypothetical protein
MKTTRMFVLALLPLPFLPGVLYAQADPADFEGVWSGYLTSQTDAYWQVEDWACFVGCPKVSYDYLKALLDDPANDERPVAQLVTDAQNFAKDYLRARSTPAGIALIDGNSEANDTNLACHPYDYVRAATNPLPLEIIHNSNTLTIRYEEWNRLRTVYLDGRAFPTTLEPSSLGYSVGRFENGSLVIETRGVTASTYPPITINAPGGHSDQLRGIERYTLEQGNPAVLSLELTLEDPGTLTNHYVYYKKWIATPDIELLIDSCEDTPGVF